MERFEFSKPVQYSMDIQSCETHSANNAIFFSVLFFTSCSERCAVYIVQNKKSNFRVFFLSFSDLHCKPFKCYINGLQYKSFENKKKTIQIYFFYFGRFALLTVCIADRHIVDLLGSYTRIVGFLL